MKINKIQQKKALKIIVAPDSFKECLSAREVSKSISKGIKEVFPNAEIIQIPLSDGGEGLLDTLVEAMDGNLVCVKVKDPLLRDISANYGIVDEGKTAVIEMATASGLELLSEEEKNPLITSSFGVGQLIADALNNNCSKIIVGLGGSATNDAGMGMIKALGGKFLNSKNEEIGDGGGALNELDSIDLSGLHPKIATCEFVAACDVSNPLTGENGASLVFGGQKGGAKEDIEELDRNLKLYASILNKTLKVEVDSVQGAGAAGGLGAALFAVLNAKMMSGIDLIIDNSQLEKNIKNADLVITGEGKIDRQTLFGKTVLGVARIAKKHQVPVIAIAGKVGADISEIYDSGVTSVFSITDQPMRLEESIRRGDELIQSRIENIMRLYE